VSAAGKPILIGIAGQPNVGKSTVFNLVTGLSQHIGNWPGKTIERREGSVPFDGTTLRIVDLPGTYSLTADSAEERIARDFILRERPDVIVMIANAAALERNLYLLAELLMLPAPVVLGLNMLDVAESQGLEIQPPVLAAALGLPVVPLVATRGEGVLPLLREALRLAREPARFSPSRPEIAAPHRAALAQVRGLLASHVPGPYEPGWVATKLLEGDREVMELAHGWLAEGEWRAIQALLGTHEDAGLDIASGWYEWIGRMTCAAVKRPYIEHVSLTDRLDRWVVHPFWGVLLLFAVSALVFAITFSVGAPAQKWLDGAGVEPLRAWVGTALSRPPPWVARLLADGVLGGAGIVVTFVPILMVFFTALGILEASGLFARAGYVMHRFMRLVGLHGKSFLPLFLGFGCNVPAVMGARIIEEPNGRLLTILLAPLVPCSARLAVLAFLTPAFFGSAALPVAVGLVTINLAVLAATGVVLSRAVFRGRRMPFIMELPLYHVPNARAIARFVWDNTFAFLRNAGTVIVVVSVLVWATAYFPGANLDQSYLARFGRALAPLGTALGLDWRMLVALLAGFIAKENAIATLGILYTSGASGAGLAETLSAQVAPATALAFLTATMLFIPCAATVATMRQETRSWRWTLFGVTLMLVIAIGAAALVYQVSRLIGVGLPHA
jgi:ferrous iron transport protein B